MSAIGDLDFTGSTVIITGAAGGIGSALARGFAARGASLALLDVNEEGVGALADELRAEGTKVLARRCDTSSEADVVAAVDATEAELGGPHVLVNNAARGSHTRPEEITLEEWNGVLAVTLTGYFLFARECGRRMLAAGSGAIVNIASILGADASRSTFQTGEPLPVTPHFHSPAVFQARSCRTFHLLQAPRSL